MCIFTSSVLASSNKRLAHATNPALIVDSLQLKFGRKPRCSLLSHVQASQLPRSEEVKQVAQSLGTLWMACASTVTQALSRCVEADSLLSSCSRSASGQRPREHVLSRLWLCEEAERTRRRREDECREHTDATFRRRQRGGACKQATRP